MSKQSTRVTGQKRKHDDIASAASPAVGNVQNTWNPANAPQYDPNAYQNNGYYQQQYDPQMVYAMQQQQAAAAMAAAANHVAANNAAQRTNEANPNPNDRQSVNQLKDAMSMGGISLREEEAYAHGKREIPTSTYTGENRALSQNFFPDDFVIKLFKLVAKHYSVKAIHPDVIALAGLAVEQRVRSLVEKVNTASQHRWETQTAFSSGFASGSGKKDEDGEEEEVNERIALYADGKTPVFDRAIRKDVGKQLMAIEKLEKAEEMRIRRERKEKQGQNKQTTGVATTPTASGDVDDDDGPPKKRKKRAEGPGVQAKNMSEETKKKLSNTVANAAAGFGSRYAWMNTGSTPLPRRPAGGGGGAGNSSAGANTNGWGGWGAGRKKGKKQSERTLSMRDVLFVVEREKGHGGGRGSARGWS